MVKYQKYTASMGSDWSILSFFQGVHLPFLRVAQTCKKESFFVCADDTDSMNDDMK